MKVVINACYGGFSISPEAALWLYEKGFKAKDFVNDAEKYFGDGFLEKKEAALEKWRDYLKSPKSKRDSLFLAIFTPDEKFILSSHLSTYQNGDEMRADPLLVECVETLGEKANGACAKLKIVEIPDGTSFVIEEYDGFEHIAESHRSWS